jgi:DNA-binding CsgD family transcriptional regulator
VGQGYFMAPAAIGRWPERCAPAELADPAPAGATLADAMQIIRALGVADPETRARSKAVVARTLESRDAGVVLWRDPIGVSVGRLIVVRPTSDTERVTVAIDALDTGPSRLTPEHLMDLFSLARSEAEIALELFRDESPAQIADARRVQLETVRGQIKTILRKIGLNSQKQLIRVLTQLSGAMA